MPHYVAPVKDVMFLLQDVLALNEHESLPGFSDVTPDLLDAILTEAAKVSENVFAPLNASGDHQGCTRHADGSVTTPDGFKEAHSAYVQAGWIGLSVDPAFGGQGLPYTLGVVVNEFATSANISLSMYPLLTMGAVAALIVHGTDAQKNTYIPNMVEGRWSGTMNLTEAHCGTDLGLITTKAVPQDDGSYRLTGSKIFISAGEHDLTENIIHLVLARIEGAPLGTKGISLFVVPKFMVKPDGSVGERNGVMCGSIEHKMGIHGNATCVMNYDGATGWLVGEANRGLNAMFVMMNEARLGVAIQGLALSEVAYQNALAYAKDRLQGRSLTGAKFPEKAADPILVHPDVRRMLLTIRSFNDAARALILWTALSADIAHRSTDVEAKRAAEDRIGLLTPVLKGVLTDWGFENTVLAQQVFGGHGYIAEWGMEQFVRDARIAMIYEGANGIQAMDLVGRKLPKDGGRALMLFLADIDAFLKKQGDERAMAFVTGPLKQARDHLQQASLWFMQNAMTKPDNAGAGAYDYMHLLGLVALGFMHGKISAVCLEKGEDSEYTSRLTVAKFFMDKILPETALRLSRIMAGSETLMTMPDDML